MDSLTIAAHQTAHENDLPTLAKKIGIPEQSLRNKVCPTNEVAKLSIQEARSMMLATGDIRILEALADDLDCKVIPNCTSETPDLLQAILSFNKEQGDVASVISEALSDGKITARELVAIEKEIGEAVSSMIKVKKAVQIKSGAKS